MVDNWNICLGYATGDYAICMGDDDKFLPNCLEEYVRLIAKYPGIGLLHGWTEIIDENSTAYQKQFIDVNMNLSFRSFGIDGMFIINSL